MVALSDQEASSEARGNYPKKDIEETQYITRVMEK